MKNTSLMIKHTNFAKYLVFTFILMCVIITKNAYSQEFRSYFQSTYIDYSKDLNIIKSDQNDIIGYTSYIYNSIILSSTNITGSGTYTSIFKKEYYVPGDDTPFRIFRMLEINSSQIAVLAKHGKKIILFFIRKSDGSIQSSYSYTGSYTYQYAGIELDALDGFDMVATGDNNNEDPTEIIIVGSIHENTNDDIHVDKVKNSIAFKILIADGSIVWSKRYDSGKNAIISDPFLVTSPDDYDSFNEIYGTIDGDFVINGTQNKWEGLYSNPLIGRNNLNSTSLNIKSIDGSIKANNNLRLSVGVCAIQNSNTSEIVNVLMDWEGFFHFLVTDNLGTTVITNRIFYISNWEHLLRHITPYNIDQDNDYYYLSVVFRDVNNTAGYNSPYPVGTTAILKIDKTTYQVVGHVLIGINGQGYIENSSYSPVDYYHRNQYLNINLFYYPTISALNVVSDHIDFVGLNNLSNPNYYLEFDRVNKALSFNYVCLQSGLYFEVVEENYQRIEDIYMYDLRIERSSISINADSIGYDRVPTCQEGSFRPIENNNNQLFYPNPNNGVFSFSSIGAKTVLVYNSYGKLVYSKEYELEMTNDIINISNQPNGLYHIRLIFNNGDVQTSIIDKK